MKRALEKDAGKSAIVIPVILHPCDWGPTPFGDLRATPTDGKPVSMHANQDEALTIIAKDIRKATEVFKEKKPFEQLKRNSPQLDTDPRHSVRSSNLRVKRIFDDHKRDNFLENSYEYIARYFDGSLQELERRNAYIKTRFKQIYNTCFTAFVYNNGERAAECTIWYGGNAFGLPIILFSKSGEGKRNEFNEALSVGDDGYTLQLKPFGMPIYLNQRKESLSQQGAAEYFWSMFIASLQ